MSAKQVKNQTANPRSSEEHSREQSFMRLGDVLAEIARSASDETLEVPTTEQPLSGEQNGGDVVTHRDRDRPRYKLRCCSSEDQVDSSLTR